MKALNNKNIWDNNKKTIKVNGNTEFLSKDPSSLNADHVTLEIFYVRRGIKVESPNPTNIQKIALAILPVIAISPKPFLVIAKDALRSARQLPQQSNVKAKNFGYNDNMNPRFVNKSIMIFDTNAIQETDCMKAIKAKKKTIFLDAYVLVVLNLM